MLASRQWTMNTPTTVDFGIHIEGLGIHGNMGNNAGVVRTGKLTQSSLTIHTLDTSGIRVGMEVISLTTITHLPHGTHMPDSSLVVTHVGLTSTVTVSTGAITRAAVLFTLPTGQPSSSAISASVSCSTNRRTRTARCRGGSSPICARSRRSSMAPEGVVVFSGILRGETFGPSVKLSALGRTFFCSTKRAVDHYATAVGVGMGDRSHPPPVSRRLVEGLLEDVFGIIEVPGNGDRRSRERPHPLGDELLESTPLDSSVSSIFRSVDASLALQTDEARRRPWCSSLAVTSRSPSDVQKVPQAGNFPVGSPGMSALR